MTPADLLDAIEAALATPGLRRHVLELTAPTVLGERGHHLGDTEHGPVYGYTRRQCRDIREVIYAAARADMDGGDG